MQHCGLRALAIAATLWCLAEAFAAFAAKSVDGHTAGQAFRDCNNYCPEMVVIPQGKFTIGTPQTEVGRGSDEILSRW